MLLAKWGLQGQDLEYPWFVFGHAECKIDKPYKFAMWKDIDLSKLNQYIVIHDFYLKKVGYYLFRVEARRLKEENVERMLTETLFMNVLDAPCDPPTITWDSAISETLEEAHLKAPFFRCRRYNVLGKALENCLKNDTHIKRTWYLRRLRDEFENNVDDDPIDMTGRKIRRPFLFPCVRKSYSFDHSPPYYVIGKKTDGKFCSLTKTSTD
jgi:hypothetical protein